VTLTTGTRLGPYVIERPIGAGGMGEVYRARDSRLDRTVAIKIIPTSIGVDVRQRFEREARAISSLSHPHICPLFDVGEHEDVDFLVMEYLDGETLAARVRKGPLPIDQVLRYAIEIASALEAAHRQGIVHRDLKPSNVMLTKTGAKLLDFGLAKAAAPAVQTGHYMQGVTLRSTVAAPITGEGTIVGTFNYMAPEQIEGKPTDARSDIFALGAVIYEMATGRKAFDGATQASVIAAIIDREPPPMTTIHPLTPSSALASRVLPALDHIVQMCLPKEPFERWQTAHDVVVQLRWIREQAAQPAALMPAGRARRSMRLLPWGLAAAGVAAAAAAWVFKPARIETTAPLTRFEVTMPAPVSLPEFGWPTISPDGRLLVVPATADNQSHLYVRRLEDTPFVLLPGTEGARFPFWSPDSRSIAFFANGKLRRIDAAGGPPTVLCDSPLGIRGSWSRDGVILFSGARGALFRVSASGGTPVQVTSLDPARRDMVHKFPLFMPDGRRFLFTVGGAEGGIYAGALDSPAVTRVLRGDAGQSFYVESGYLLVVRQQTLMAVPFDAQRLEPTGAAIPIALHVRGGLFSAALNGNIAFRSGGDAIQLAWYGRDGRRAGVVGAPGPYRQIALAPSGRRLAIQEGMPGFAVESDGDLWLMDLTTGVHSRLTSDPAFDGDPSWSPDERSLAFTSARIGRETVFRKDLVSGVEEPITDIADPVAVDEWTPDGRFILFRTFGKAIYAMPTAGDRKPRMISDTPGSKDQSHLSPDGRWIAFNADESGGWEVYVARFPDFSGKRQVSNRGGTQPLWRGDSRELFYLSPQGMLMAVEMRSADNTQPSVPRPLFQTSLTPGAGVGQYAVTPNGQRFLIADPATKDDQSITLILNWTPPRQQ